LQQPSSSAAACKFSETLVRTLRRHPGADVVNLLENLIEAKGDGGRPILLFTEGTWAPGPRPMVISGVERVPPGTPRQEGAQRALESISESRPRSAEEIVKN
jgi:hypothetical protein